MGLPLRWVAQNRWTKELAFLNGKARQLGGITQFELSQHTGALIVGGLWTATKLMGDFFHAICPQRAPTILVVRGRSGV
jgi:hypothetical protein